VLISRQSKLTQVHWSATTRPTATDVLDPLLPASGSRDEPASSPSLYRLYRSSSSFGWPELYYTDTYSKIKLFQSRMLSRRPLMQTVECRQCSDTNYVLLHTTTAESNDSWCSPYRSSRELAAPTLLLVTPGHTII